ncbi:MAG: hypothetical protein LBJ46_02775 [Planctomycetota bacterium]|nr:hypothetical protein [Planctomycetota bacterium]
MNRTCTVTEVPEFYLPYRPPYEWDTILAFLESRIIPGVEMVRDGVYRSMDGRIPCDAGARLSGCISAYRSLH